MPEFRSFSKLEEFLKNAIQKAIKDEPPKTVKRTMRRHIEHDVYGEYSPKQYIRRGTDGGLADEDNIVIKNKEDNIVEIYNIAKRNMRYTERYLTPLIELGHRKYEDKYGKGTGYKYPYPQFTYYHPRPFVKKTRRSLRRGKLHINAFKKSLKKYGIDSE